MKILETQGQHNGHTEGTNDGGAHNGSNDTGLEEVADVEVAITDRVFQLASSHVGEPRDRQAHRCACCQGGGHDQQTRVRDVQAVADLRCDGHEEYCCNSVRL